MLLFLLLLPLVLSTAALNETLDILPQHDGKVVFRFAFTTATAQQASGKGHYNLFPRMLGRVVDELAVDELAISFTQGRWRYALWNDAFSPSAPSGVHFWAWFRTDHPRSVDQRWRALTNALSGLFCASLNFIDETVTTSPQRSFASRGQNATAIELRYGSLPRESVCTENLTPWAKLLPCQKKSGLATLLNAYKIFDSSYSSIGLDMHTTCTAEGECVRHLSQSLTIVADPVRAFGEQHFSLQSIFDRQLSGACPLADVSLVRVRTPPSLHQHYTLSPLDFTTKNHENGDTISTYDLKSINLPTPFDVGMLYTLNTSASQLENSVIYHPSVTFVRHLTGYGQDKGGIQVRITNHSPQQQPVELIYFDMIPWYIRPLLHTLTIIQSSATAQPESIHPKLFTLQPALDRRRPTVFEMSITVPFGESIVISFDFYKAFIRYTEHRPDANRGFDIGSGVLTLMNDTIATIEHARRLYGDNILLQLPTPDFSMPYNVITFSCTIIAFFFGTMFSSFTRTLTFVDASTSES